MVYQSNIDLLLTNTRLYKAFTAAATTNCEHFNTLRPRQNGRHFPDDMSKCTFLNENVSIVIKFSLKLVPKCSINNIPALVQIMAWRRPGDKPLSEPMMVILLTHKCVSRPQWVNCWSFCRVIWMCVVQHLRCMVSYGFVLGWNSLLCGKKSLLHQIAVPYVI